MDCNACMYLQTESGSPETSISRPPTLDASTRNTGTKQLQLEICKNCVKVQPFRILNHHIEFLKHTEEALPWKPPETVKMWHMILITAARARVRVQHSCPLTPSSTIWSHSPISRRSEMNQSQLFSYKRFVTKSQGWEQLWSNPLLGAVSVRPTQMATQSCRDTSWIKCSIQNVCVQLQSKNTEFNVLGSKVTANKPNLTHTTRGSHVIRCLFHHEGLLGHEISDTVLWEPTTMICKNCYGHWLNYKLKHKYEPSEARSSPKINSYLKEITTYLHNKDFTMFRERIAVYCGNQAKHTNTLFGQNAERKLKQVVYTVTTARFKS
jgi:hypothetical protein